jgi:hypothetical protein
MMILLKVTKKTEKRFSTIKKSMKFFAEVSKNTKFSKKWTKRGTIQRGKARDSEKLKLKTLI